MGGLLDSNGLEIRKRKRSLGGNQKALGDDVRRSRISRDVREERLQEAVGIRDEEDSYTLADAMREGSKVTNQAIGSWTGVQGETCALSAAYLAVKARGLA